MFEFNPEPTNPQIHWNKFELVVLRRKISLDTNSRIKDLLLARYGIGLTIDRIELAEYDTRLN